MSQECVVDEAAPDQEASARLKAHMDHCHVHDSEVRALIEKAEHMRSAISGHTSDNGDSYVVEYAMVMNVIYDILERIEGLSKAMLVNRRQFRFICRQV